ENIQNRFDLPVISISSNNENFFDEETGIYSENNVMKRGSEWERPMHIEFFDKNGKLGFSQNGGVRLHGGATRNYSQKTLRLYADHEYDNKDKFKHDIFKGLKKRISNEPKEEFKTLLLRNSGNDWNRTMFRDALMQSLVEPLES